MDVSRKRRTADNGRFFSGTSFSSDDEDVHEEYFCLVQKPVPVDNQLTGEDDMTTEEKEFLELMATVGGAVAAFKFFTSPAGRTLLAATGIAGVLAVGTVVGACALFFVVPPVVQRAILRGIGALLSK